jgi:hypothetical protein
MNADELRQAREQASAGLTLLADCWSQSGRATVRVSEIRAVAKAMECGEWDDFFQGVVRFPGQPIQ